MLLMESRRWIGMSQIAIQVRQSSYEFALLASINVLSVAFSVGTPLFSDLRGCYT
jgi:hypothetical protein